MDGAKTDTFPPRALRVSARPLYPSAVRRSNRTFNGEQLARDGTATPSHRPAVPAVVTGVAP